MDEDNTQTTAPENNAGREYATADDHMDLRKKLTLVSIISVVVFIAMSIGLISFFKQNLELRGEVAKLQAEIGEVRDGKQTAEENLSFITDRLKKAEQRILILEKALSISEDEMRNIERTFCNGVYVDGECVAFSCTDSDDRYSDEDIYHTGKVVYINEEGVEAEEIDVCQSGGTRLVEWSCTETVDGMATAEKVVYSCEDGCARGKCKQRVSN